MRVGFAILLRACGARSELAGAVDAAVEEEASAPLECSLHVKQLATTGAQPDAIALDGHGFVYWHDANGVSRAPIAGGAATLVAQADAHLWPDLVPFAIAGNHVFLAIELGQIVRAPVAGGPVELLQPQLTQPVAFAASASHVYAWTRDGPTSVLLQLAYDGSGGTTVFATLDHAPSEMTFVSPETAYIAADPEVRAIDFSQGPSAGQLLIGLLSVDVAVAGKTVFFTTNDATNGARLMKLSTTTLSATPIADTAGATAIALDGEDVYFTDTTSLRVRVARPNGVLEVASAPPKFTPIDVVIDDTCVYWTLASREDGFGPGAVVAGPKPLH